MVEQKKYSYIVWIVVGGAATTFARNKLKQWKSNKEIMQTAEPTNGVTKVSNKEESETILSPISDKIQVVVPPKLIEQPTPPVETTPVLEEQPTPHFESPSLSEEPATQEPSVSLDAHSIPHKTGHADTDEPPVPNEEVADIVGDDAEKSLETVSPQILKPENIHLESSDVEVKQADTEIHEPLQDLGIDKSNVDIKGKSMKPVISVVLKPFLFPFHACSAAFHSIIRNRVRAWLKTPATVGLFEEFLVDILGKDAVVAKVTSELSAIACSDDVLSAARLTLNEAFKSVEVQDRLKQVGENTAVSVLHSPATQDALVSRFRSFVQDPAVRDAASASLLRSLWPFSKA